MNSVRIVIIIIIGLYLKVDSFAQYNNVIQKGNKLYLANTIVFKLKDSQRQTDKSDLLQKAAFSNILKKESITSSRYILPNQAANSSLGNIIMMTYSSNKDPELLSEELTKSGEVEWCEPKFVYKVEYVPTDTALYRQYHLTKIKAAEAWDITRGDTSIVIAIIDTGVDWDHPDLTANIWRNWDEIPNNGLDDDNNGYHDDIRGWDFGGVNGIPDNDPMEDKPDHGTHVAGISSAVTNNVTGIASIGFNSKIMAVKTSRNDVRDVNGQALIYYGYEGIVYAAENGAKVINLSWGGSGYSVFGQEVVNFAISKGALIVASAGNENSRGLFYPSSYNGVLSVASSDINDRKSSFSNFGISVDVTAPGESIYSTWQNNVYTTATGTSMSSPLVAGLAALVTQQFPLFNPLQIAEQIRVNTDDIYSLNGFYRNLLGKGRVNAFNAVNNKTSVSVRSQGFVADDDAGDNDDIFEPGEVINITVQFINLLNTIDNLVVSVEAADLYSSVVNGSFNAGTRGTLELFDNSSSKFSIQLSNTVPQNTEITLKLNFSSGSYQDFQLFTFPVNPSYADQSNGKIAMTIGSDGTLGFIDFFQNSKGNGFKYDGSENLLYEGALILGTSPASISDAARIDDTRSFDFVTVKPFMINIPGEAADQQGLTIFNDDGSGDSRIGTTIHLKTYSYANEAEDDFIILRYTIKNEMATNISGLYTGLFFDWDFADASNDLTAYDTQGNLGYVQRVGGDPDIWVATASGDVLKGGFYAIMNDGTMGNLNIYDGFSDAEKWTAISGGIGVQSAGPGDVSHVINNGPYNIASGDSIEVPFIVAAGKSLDELRAVVNTARIRYNAILVDADEDSPVLLEYNLSQNYPNPFNPSTRIEFIIPDQQVVSLKIFNILGEESLVLLNKELPSGKHSFDFNPAEYNLAGGVYMYQITAGDYHSVKKMVYIK